MSAPAWMPLYVADYLADTLHLNATQSGAYLHLIMHYWQHDGIPNDDESLASICRLEAEEWTRIRAKILGFFQEKNGDFRHKRIDREIASAKKISKARSLAGVAGASARYGKRIANAKQTHAPSPSPSPIKNKKEATTVAKKEAPPKRALHLPAGYAELSRVLDDERTKAVIEHRQKFKKPLTAHAAKLLAQKFEQCPNPNEAADEMVARGWQGFKPEWLQQANAKPVPTAQPPPHQYDPNIPPERLEEMLADIEREFGGRRIR